MFVYHRRFIQAVLFVISILIVIPVSQADVRGYYKFNVLNDLGLDSSEYSNHAVWGEVASTPGYTGYAFLGTGQTYLEFDPLFSNSVNNYTVSAWIKKLYPAVDTYEYIYYDSNYKVGLYHQKDINEINYCWGSQSSPANWRSNLVVPHNKWVFVAVVVEPSKATVYLYKDGQMSSAVHNYSHAAKSCGYSYIAGQYWYEPYYGQTVGFFRGAIDDLRVYNHALTSNEVLSLVNGINSPPRIDAGEDQDISLSSTTLNGSIQDDGMPNPPGRPTLNWSKVSGPGTVTFSPGADILNPTAEFSVYGTYVLKLTVSDGQYQGSDTLTVIYQPVYIRAGAIKVTSSNIYGDFANPDVNKIKDSSGLGADKLHNNSFYDMCYIWDTTGSHEKYDYEISTEGRVWFAFEFDRIYTIKKVLLWNYNHVPDYGMKQITIAYSTNKDSWTEVDYQLNRTPGTAGIQPEIFDAGLIHAKYVVIIAKSNYESGSQNKFGLSEVQFEYAGGNGNKATSPQPANNSTNPALDVKLSWLTGVSPKIVSHKVYISSYSSLVENRTSSYINTANPYYVTNGLVAGQKYYWAVDALDVYGHVVAGGKGDLWNFTVGEMEIRYFGVNGTLLGQIPVEKIQLDTGNAGIFSDAQMALSKNGEIYGTINGANRLYKSWDRGRTWSYKDLGSIIPWSMASAPGTSTHFTIQRDDSFFILRVPEDGYDYPTWDRWAIDVYRSFDYGSTWQTITRIWANPQAFINEGTESVTRTYDGRLLFPIKRWSWDYVDTNDLNPWSDRYSPEAYLENRMEDQIYYSDNNGVTWQRTITSPFWSEPQIIQLHSGKLLASVRYQRSWIPEGIPGFTADTNESVTAWGGVYTYKYDTSDTPWGGSVFKNLFVNDSFDNGATWQGLRPMQDSNGDTLGIFGEAHGQLVQVPDGRVVMVHDHRYPTTESQVIARVSCDEGITWETEVFKLSTYGDYPSSVALEDGTIVTFTGTNNSAPYQSVAIRWRLPDKKTGTPKANLKMVRKYAIVGRKVLFDAGNSTDTENNIAKYEWDFQGNYNFDYNETASNHSDGAFDGKTKYVYTAAGDYTVRVRVTDSNGLNDTYNLYHIIVSEDLDNDDMADGWETRNGLDPNNASDALIDSDGDGHINLSEYLHQSNPYNDHSLPLPTTIFVPADIGSYQQAEALAIVGDEIIMSIDLNNDEKVDVVDFALFSQNWMDTNCGYCNGADFTGDGNVDWKDLAWIIENWLEGK